MSSTYDLHVCRVRAGHAPCSRSATSVVRGRRRPLNCGSTAARCRVCATILLHAQGRAPHVVPAPGRELGPSGCRGGRTHRDAMDRASFDPTPMLSVEEVAAKCAVSKDTVRKWHATGVGLRWYRLGPARWLETCASRAQAVRRGRYQTTVVGTDDRGPVERTVDGTAACQGCWVRSTRGRAPSSSAAPFALGLVQVRKILLL